MLVSTSPALTAAVEVELKRQANTLPTVQTALRALAGGFAVDARDLGEAVNLCNEIAPEHLELHVRDPEQVVPRLRNCGCLFIGSPAAEVLGDYAAGPNHTLPTGGTARFASGLSVASFLRQQTWIRVESESAADELLADAHALACLEGLAGHARSADLRRILRKGP